MLRDIHFRHYRYSTTIYFIYNFKNIWNRYLIQNYSRIGPVLQSDMQTPTPRLQKVTKFFSPKICATLWNVCKKIRFFEGGLGGQSTPNTKFIFAHFFLRQFCFKMRFRRFSEEIFSPEFFFCFCIRFAYASFGIRNSIWPLFEKEGGRSMSFFRKYPLEYITNQVYQWYD